MENEESERLRLREDIFLESNLKEYNYDNGYVFGVYDGDIEQFINRYMAVNSSCFAKSAFTTRKRVTKGSPYPKMYDHNQLRNIYGIQPMFLSEPLTIWNLLAGADKERPGCSKTRGTG